MRHRGVLIAPILLAACLSIPAGGHQDYGLSTAGQTSMKIMALDKKLPVTLTLEVEDGKTIDAFLVAMDKAYAADIEDGMLFNDDRVTLTILTSWPGISGFQDFIYTPEDHPEILEDKTIDKVCLIMINTDGPDVSGSDRKVGVSLSFSKGVRAASLVAGIILSLPAIAVFLMPAVRALKKRFK
ncbi:MAG: hypothetical protein SCM96_06075 [Acidobacteriota bacterium]|nr:hypothetical protein [Acidobacteriota bacterium]